MPLNRVLVTGASAGGVGTLMELVGGLPADLPAAVFVTLHVSSHGPSVLPGILSRRGALPAEHARDGEPVLPGRILIAPPDHHLLVEPGHVRLTRGPRENSARPAIDPMFRTAARAYGARVAGVILSGTLDDGTAGCRAVKHYGGLTVIQDPADAVYADMPESAIRGDHPDYILPLADIPACLIRLAAEAVPDGETGFPEVVPDLAEMAMNALRSQDPAGTPSGFGCPECEGSLFEVEQEGSRRFRCRVGHAYSPETLLAEQGERLETALWTALRALEENAAFSWRLCDRMDESSGGVAERFRRRAERSERDAEVIRGVLRQGDAVPAAWAGNA